MVLALRSLAAAATLTLLVEKPWLVLRRRALRRSSIGCEEPGGACPPAAALVRLLPAFVCHFLLCRGDAECRRCLGRRVLRVQPDRVRSLPLAEKKNFMSFGVKTWICTQGSFARPHVESCAEMPLW